VNQTEMGGPPKAGVLTISDKGSQGKREDRSGEVAAVMIRDLGFPVVKRDIVPDELARIRDTLCRWVDHDGLRLIVTSGGRA
jgi:molybdopterin adenylyltransferase